MLSRTNLRQSSTLASKLREIVAPTVSKVQQPTGSDIVRDETGEEFREMFVKPKRKLRAQIQLEQLMGRTQAQKYSRVDLGDRLAVRRPRAEEMSPDQDWTAVWPAARSFNASVVPLPIRMGTRRKPEKRAPFKKVGNLELVKIPNFLHLTPSAIKQHCDAIRKFCTEYPAELKNNPELEEEVFPVTYHYNDYVHQGSSIRDFRSRVVTATFSLKALKLTEEQSNKYKRLVGKRYDPDTDRLQFLTDRCHTRRQNFDYTEYLLTATYFESKKVEPWEEMRSRADELVVYFDGSKAQEKAQKLVSAQPQRDEKESTAALENYKKVWEAYRNEKETPDAARNYGDAVRALLGLPQAKSSRSPSTAAQA